MVGKHLSHYIIDAELGRGGMGIVYLATDTKLNRQVALKVLPAAALTSDDDRERFFREAQAAAQLTHPHIATVYEIDEAILKDASGNEQNATDGPRPFIAMEYIEGETLEERIKNGPLKLKEAVRIATEIADALKAAHGKDIVHRDIKSANVMLTAEGKAKVLDFGLAKTAHSTMLTRMGSTLGTVAYMSPEQARGEEVDSRTDLYSLGTVLYEMIAGSRPFAGEYEQAVVYAILNEAPAPLTSVRTGVPMNLEWLVNKCLAKSAEDRYQSAAGLMVDLRNLDLSASGVSQISPGMSGSFAPVLNTTTSQTTASQSAAQPTPQNQRTRPSIAIIASIAAVTALLGLLAGFLAFGDTEEPLPLAKVVIDLPGLSNIRFFRVSPTREYMVFSGFHENGNVGIFFREMASGEIRYIDGTDIMTGVASREIIFSPDGQRIAFTHGENGGVSTVVVPTGLPERQTDSGRLSFWESESSFIFVDDRPGGLTYRKIIGNTEPELIELDHGELGAGYVTNWKTRIPGSGIAFGHQLRRRGGDVQNETSWLVRGLIKDGQTVTRVESPIMNPEYVAGGFLVYQQKNDYGTLVVRPVDQNSGEFLGPPREVLADERTRWGLYSISRDGDLFYRPTDGESPDGAARLYLIDIENQQVSAVQLIIPNGAEIADATFSSDGNRIAITAGIPRENDHIYIYDLQDGTTTQITFGLDAFLPTWSWDSKWLYFSVNGNGSSAIYRQRPDASSEPEQIVDNAMIGDVSPDGRNLAFSRPDSGASVGEGLMLFDMESKEITPLDTSPGYNGSGQFSPDGKYVVYEHYNNRFLLRVVSIDGLRVSNIPDVNGRIPRWSADGNNIYLSGQLTVQIPVRSIPSLNVLGEPSVLFSAVDVDGFDISPDGKIAVLIATDYSFEGSIPTETGSQIIWLQNWSDHLKREFAK